MNNDELMQRIDELQAVQIAHGTVLSTLVGLSPHAKETLKMQLEGIEALTLNSSLSELALDRLHQEVRAFAGLPRGE